jgi:flagellar basal-body rod protein FlgC
MAGVSDTFTISASGMRAQAERLRLVTENIANADTPGYRRKLVSFAQTVNRETGTPGVEPGRVRLDPGDRTRIHAPGHPLAGPDGYYEGSNVNLVVEIADARESQRSYEANLKMFDQARDMARAALDLLRR